MKPLSSFFLALLVSGTFCDRMAAQDTAVADTAVTDIDARRESVVVLEQRIAQRQTRLDALGTEITALDTRVETMVADIVDKASSVRDSVDSQVRVAMLKADIVSGLKNSIETYARHRDSIGQQLRLDNPAIPRATLQSDFDVFNKRIELRVEQIKKITESFTDPRDLPKYEKTGGHSWGRWHFQDEKISDAWRQDRKEGRHTDSAKDQTIEALRGSIDHLTQRNALMTANLESIHLTSVERELYTSEIERNNTLIGSREAQIQSIQSSSASLDAIKPMERNAAHEAELHVRDLRTDLRADFFTIFRKYAELNQQRTELHQMTQNLDARVVWLKDYDAKQAK